MEEKKDIGTFFKDKLKDGEKSPNQDIWDRINKSLDKKGHTGNSSLRHWLVGLGIPVLVGGFLLLNIFEGDEKHSELPERNSPDELLFSPLEKEIDKKENKVSTVDYLTEINESEKVNSEFTTTDKNSKENATQNLSEIFTENKSEKSSPKSTQIDETYTISKKYHYYNSENEEQWTTTDKNKIDSLLSNKNKVLDSTTTTKTNDSLTQ